MRLTTEEITIIKQSIFALDPKAEIYIFVSRADDTKKGGDIDLLVISKRLNRSHEIEILAAIFDRIEEQKIDLMIEYDLTNPMAKHAAATGIKL